jgi:hypothetical protein
VYKHNRPPPPKKVFVITPKNLKFWTGKYGVPWVIEESVFMFDVA